jgi:hypothetical protein
MDFAPFYRPKELCGPNGIFRVSRAKLYDDFIYRPGGPKLISGTTVERLKIVKLGEQAVAVSGAEVKRVAEALSADVVESDEPVPRQRSTRR